MTAWTAVCPVRAILPGAGVTALIDGRQVAIVRTADDRVFALDNHDPCSGANVLARGLVGDAQGRAFVASPLHKQRFDLETGACLDADATVAVHAVRVQAGTVEVAVSDRPPTDQS